MEITIIGYISGLYRGGNIGIIENSMETTVVYWGYISPKLTWITGRSSVRAPVLLKDAYAYKVRGLFVE